MKSNNDPVIQLLDLVWEQANSEVSHSWERLNHAMRGALRLAVGAGFEFAEDTLAKVAGKYRFSRWCGDSVEWIYTQAIAEGNIAAAQSFEAWQGRAPFIADDVDLGRNHHYAHMASSRQRERLAVGFQFNWKGKRVTVTSFAPGDSVTADGGGSLTACSYKAQAADDYSNKVEKRFTITRDDIIADRAERKERKALVARLVKAGKNDGCKAIIAALGVKSQADVDGLPINKIRKVAAKFAPEDKPAPTEVPA